MHSADPTEIAKTILETFAKKEQLVYWGKTGTKIIENYIWEKVAADLNKYLSSIKS